MPAGGVLLGNVYAVFGGIWMLTRPHRPASGGEACGLLKTFLSKSPDLYERYMAKGFPRGDALSVTACTAIFRRCWQVSPNVRCAAAPVVTIKRPDGRNIRVSRTACRGCG